MSKQTDDDETINDSDSQYAEAYEDEEEALRSSMIPAFLSKTYSIMHDESFKDIVCWGDNGESILILNVDEFSKIVLPKFFKHGNFSSFVRQLNMYGFHKTRQDPNWREFKHPLFKRGHLELLPLIKRKNGGRGKGEKREHVYDTNEKNLSVNLKKTRMDRDIFLRELTMLKKKTDDMESKYTNVLRENQMLWQKLLSSKKQQDMMKHQIERICRFMYKINPQMRLGDDPSNTYLLTNKASEVGDDLNYLPGSDEVLTPDQYNNTLDYLQLSTVPRVESPRNLPMRSIYDDGRRPVPTTRMLTNDPHGSMLMPKESLPLPSLSPSLFPGEATPLDLDDVPSFDALSSEMRASPALVPPVDATTYLNEPAKATNSPIPPLDLGKSAVDEENVLVLDTSKPRDVSSNTSEVALPPQLPSSFPFTLDTSPEDPASNPLDILQDSIQKVGETSSNLQKKLSIMENDLSTPFMSPNLEAMEKKGML